MHDPKCYQLAKAFLEDHPRINTEENCRKLADEIQDSIEVWIEDALP